MAKRLNSTRVHANMFGYRGVEWSKEKNKFRARIEPATGVRGRWLGTFDTAEEAACAYDDAARDVYGTDAFLNFPREGEKAVIESLQSEGFCPNGHDLREHGYNRPDGRGLHCRKCNSAASLRRYYRNKAASATTSSITTR